MVIHGTVIRVTSQRNRETKKDFACSNCGKIYSVRSDIMEYNNFVLPQVCGGEFEKAHNPFINMINAMKRKGTYSKMFGPSSHIGACNSRRFTDCHGTAQYKDY